MYLKRFLLIGGAVLSLQAHAVRKGEPVSLGSPLWRHTVSLNIFMMEPGNFNDPGEQRNCSGVLFGNNGILTAAHCLKSKNPKRIVTGIGYNYFRGSQISASLVNFMSRHITPGKPPEFTTFVSPTGADVGLIVAREKLTSDEFISPANSGTVTVLNASVGDTVYALGTSTVSDKDRVLHKYSDVTIVKDPELRLARLKIATFQHGGGDELTIVATGRAQPCKGDSGGPVFVKESSGYVLFGLISASQGYSCTVNGGLNYFVSLQSQYPWLSDKYYEGLSQFEKQAGK